MKENMESHETPQPIETVFQEIGLRYLPKPNTDKQTNRGYIEIEGPRDAVSAFVVALATTDARAGYETRMKKQEAEQALNGFGNIDLVFSGKMIRMNPSMGEGDEIKLSFGGGGNSTTYREMEMAIETTAQKISDAKKQKQDSSV
jgi:hypothetical protein